MPAILERLVGQLKGKGMPQGKAYAVATASLQKAGDLKPGTAQATPKGALRGGMTPAARAKDRAAKAAPGHKPEDYTYDAGTNRAKLRDTR